MNYRPALLIGIAVVALSACNSTNSNSSRGYEMRVRYAEITEVRREPLPSAAPAGAVVGGFTGLVLARRQSGGRQIASGIGGAALGALAASALEGDRRGYAYTLRYADGTTSRFVTEKGYLQSGDCVSIERGQYANIRRVPNTLCSGGRTIAQVDEEHRRDARLCHDSKGQLLAAATSEEIEAASRKVEILCDF